MPCQSVNFMTCRASQFMQILINISLQGHDSAELFGDQLPSTSNGWQRGTGISRRRHFAPRANAGNTTIIGQLLRNEGVVRRPGAPEIWRARDQPASVWVQATQAPCRARQACHRQTCPGKLRCIPHPRIAAAPGAVGYRMAGKPTCRSSRIRGATWHRAPATGAAARPAATALHEVLDARD